MREGLRIILEDAPDIEVSGEAENGVIATQIAETRHPDVILMDIRMPLLDGIEATERIRKQATQGPRILLLTTFDTPELVVEGMRAGAAGYLLKDCSAEELCTPCGPSRVGRFSCKHPAQLSSWPGSTHRSHKPLRRPG